MHHVRLNSGNQLHVLAWQSDGQGPGCLQKARMWLQCGSVQITGVHHH